MSEADIVKAIMRYLKTVPGCFCWKEHGGMYGTAGIPDIIACIRGHFYGFEVKTQSGRPTELQEAVIRKILAAGGTALVVRSVDEVRAVVDCSLRHKSTERCREVVHMTEKENYEALGNAIVLQAVRDWRMAVRALKERPRYRLAKSMKEECEFFFRSEWFKTLTDADGNVLLRKLKQEEGIYDS